MKISDLSNKEQTNEGFMDAVARTGIMGQANKQSSVQKQENERAKSIGLKDFTNKLNSALQSAIKSGIVRPPVAAATSTSTLNQNPEQASKSAALKAQAISAVQDNRQQSSSRNAPALTPAQQKAAEIKADQERLSSGTNESQYKLFNKLIESQILDEEAESVSKFITDFIKNQTRALVDNPNYQQNIDMIAKKLENSYTKNKRLDPTLVDQAWETIWAWSQLGKKQGGYGQQSQKFDDQRDKWLSTITNMLKKVDVNDPDQYGQLAKLGQAITAFATQQKT